MDVDLELCQQRGGIAVGAGPVDPWSVASFAPEEDVFGHGHGLDEGEFLIDDGEAGAVGIGQAAEACFCAVEADFSLIGTVRVQAGEGFDEGGFSGAILSAEGVDFTRLEVE